MSKVIELKNISKKYPGKLVLDQINFEVGQGEVHGFLGPNGAGKTTTLNIISGLINPTEGEIRILGKELQSYQKELYKYLGILPENPPLYPHMIVKEYLHFVAKIHGLTCFKYVDRVLDRCGLKEVQIRYQRFPLQEILHL